MRVWKAPAVLATVVLVAVCGLSACGDDSPSQQELDQARKEGAQDALDQAQARKQQRQIKKLQKKVKQASKGGSGSGSSGGTGGAAVSTSGIPSNATSCADDVYAGPNTSCEFALNVSANYYGSGRSTNIDVFSPVTDQNYVMTCTGDSPTVCRGGNDASVYLP